MDLPEIYRDLQGSGQPTRTMELPAGRREGSMPSIFPILTGISTPWIFTGEDSRWT